MGRFHSHFISTCAALQILCLYSLAIRRLANGILHLTFCKFVGVCLMVFGFTHFTSDCAHSRLHFEYFGVISLGIRQLIDLHISFEACTVRLHTFEVGQIFSVVLLFFFKNIFSICFILYKNYMIIQFFFYLRCSAIDINILNYYIISMYEIFSNTISYKY